MVQDPADCDSLSMPRSVLVTGGADFVLPLRRIAHALVSLVMVPRLSAALFGVPLAVP